MDEGSELRGGGSHGAQRGAAGHLDDPATLIAANLRAERVRAELSLSALARRAGVSKSTLSQLEAGSGNPSVETLWAIATTLGIPLSRLLAAPQATTRVVRADERSPLASDQANYLASLLAPGNGHERRDLYVIEVEPGAPRESRPHPRGSVEHAIVAAGRVLIGTESDAVELGVGDYVTYPGDVPHYCEALEPGSWLVLMMEHPGA